MKTCTFALPRSRDRIVLYQRMNQKQLLTLQVDRKIKGEKNLLSPQINRFNHVHLPYVSHTI